MPLIFAAAVVIALRLHAAAKDMPTDSALDRAEIRRRIHEWGSSTLPDAAARFRDRYLLPGDGAPQPSEFPNSRLVKEFRFPDEPVLLLMLQTQITSYCRMAEAGVPGKDRADLTEELHQASGRGDDGEGYQI